MHRVTDFTEIKAYVDVFNEHGHKGFSKPIDPFMWWNFKWKGKVDDTVHAYYDDGLVVVLELEGTSTVKNLLVFALCPQKNILPRILDILKNYGTIIYNSEFRDRYRSITRRLDGAEWQSDGRFFYSADGESAWALYNRQ